MAQSCKPAAEVATLYASIQKGSSPGKWMVLKYYAKAAKKIKAGTVTVLASADKDTESKEQESVIEAAAHKAFTDSVKANSPCFGIIDYKQKMFFISYIPETAKPWDKMGMASVREDLKGKFEGIHVDLQCTDNGDLEIKKFDAKIKKN